jgi:hypothetical protein
MFGKRKAKPEATSEHALGDVMEMDLHKIGSPENCAHNVHVTCDEQSHELKVTFIVWF